MNAAAPAVIYLSLVIDVSALQMLLVAVTAWLDRRDREALAYLVEENRVLTRRLGGLDPIRLTG